MTEHSGGQQPPHDDASTQPVGQQPSAYPVGSEPLGSTEVLTLGQPGDVFPAESPAGSSGRRRGVAIGAGVLASPCSVAAPPSRRASSSGGGAQPDEAVPASAVAFFAVDFDPSAGPEDRRPALRPQVPQRRREDRLRTTTCARRSSTRMKDDGDRQGRLGHGRRAVAGRPGRPGRAPAAQDGDDPGVVVVLAVKDAAKAKAGLAKVSDGKAACEVEGDFAVCAEDAAVAKKAVADAKAQPAVGVEELQPTTMDALGDKGIAHAWVDLAGVQAGRPDLGRACSSALAGADLTGRVAVALRFDGPHLELAGRSFGMKVPAASGTVSMATCLPDSLAAIGLSGADQSFLDAFAGARKAADQAARRQRPGRRPARGVRAADRHRRSRTTSPRRWATGSAWCSAASTRACPRSARVSAATVARSTRSSTRPVTWAGSTLGKADAGVGHRAGVHPGLR